MGRSPFPSPASLLLLFYLLNDSSLQRKRVQRGSSDNYTVCGIIIVYLILQGNHVPPPVVGWASCTLSQ